MRLYRRANPDGNPRQLTSEAPGTPYGLAVQLRCPLAITSLCVTEGALVLAAGALICLEIDGLSPLTRTRIWQPPFTGDSSHQPTARQVPETG